MDPHTDTKSDEALAKIASMEAFLRVTISNSTADQSTLSSNSDLPYERVGDYELLAELGRGGMGIVYKARQLSLNRVVALKMVLAGGRATPEQLVRFRLEAEAIAKLKHQSIVHVFETGSHNGAPFFAMEYVDGVNLSRHLSGKPLPSRLASELAVELTSAIHYSHQRGIIHRDLKPANVLIDQRTDGRMAIKITDFGLAKRAGDDSGMTQTGEVMGTPSYMAPEQAEGRRGIDERADIYSIGAILYEMLVGGPPFRGATLMETLHQVKNVEPVPPGRMNPSVPRDLEVICLKCLHKDPRRRYQSAEAMRADLNRFLTGHSILARPISRTERVWRWCKRNPTVAGLLTIVAATVTAGLLGVLFFAFQAKTEERRAQKSKEQETLARIEAQQAASRLRDGLVRQNVTAGRFHLDSGDCAKAMWSFLRAWEIDDTADDSIHRTRLGMALATGPQLVGACFHTSPVVDAQFHPSGKVVLTRTENGKVYLWQPHTSTLLHSLEHPVPVHAAIIRPDGVVVTGGEDGVVRWWDDRSGKLIRSDSVGSPILSMTVLSPSFTLPGLLRGNSVAIGAQNGMVHFRYADGNTIRSPLKASGAVYHLACSLDGKRLVSADASHEARVWCLDSGKCMLGPVPHRDHREKNELAIKYRAFPVLEPSGVLLATSPKNHDRQFTVTIWNTETGITVANDLKFGFYVRQFNFDQSGKWLYVNAGETTSILQRPSFTRLQDRQIKHPRESPHTALSNDGRLLASCSTGGIVHFWSPLTGKEIEERARCADGVHSLQFSPDQRLLLAGSHDGTARVWQVVANSAENYGLDCGRANRARFSTSNGPLRFSADGKRVAVVRVDGLHLIESSDPNQSTRVIGADPIRDVNFLNNGNVAVEFATNIVRFYDFASGKQLGVDVQLSSSLHGLQSSRNGRRVLLVENGSSELPNARAISVYDSLTGRPILSRRDTWASGPHVFDFPELHGRLTAAALSPTDDQVFVGSSASGSVGVWDVDSGKEQAQRMCFRGLIYGIIPSEDGEHILAHASDGVVRLWSTSTLEPVGPPIRHDSFPKTADLANDGWRVVTMDGQNVIRIWDGRTGDLIGRLTPSVHRSVKQMWLSGGLPRIIVRSRDAYHNHSIASFDRSRSDLPDLLQLLTGLQRDSDDVLGPVEQTLFVKNADRFRSVWQGWRKQSGD